MNVTKENLENMEMALTVEVPAEEWEKAIKQAINRIAHSINIPGFRKGKAPRSIIERTVGIDAVLDEAYEICAPDAFDKVLRDENIELGAYPKFERVTAVAGQPLVFKAVIVPKPAVTLGEYKGVKVEKKTVEVAEEEVAKHIDRMRERKAKLVDAPADAVVANGDMITLDFKGFVDDEAFEGGEGKDYPLSIGSGAFIPGFEEQLIGVAVGGEKDVEVTFPEQYHSEKLAGRPAVFKCKVNSIKHKELPELTDEFVKENSTFQTVDELKNDVKENLLRQAENKAKQDREEAAIDKAVENATLEVPPQMVEDRINQMIESMANRLESQGLKFEQYLQYTGTDMTRLRADYKETAVKSVKADLVLEEISKKEEIKVTAEEIETEIEAMAKAYNATPAQVKKIIREQGTYGGLVANIGRRKTAQLIIDNMAE